MPKFDWGRFRDDKVAVRCCTEDEARDFVGKCYKHGMECNGTGEEYLPKQASSRPIQIAYNNNGSRALGYVGSGSFYQDSGYEIIDWSEYMRPSRKELKAEIKRLEEENAEAAKLLRYSHNYADVSCQLASMGCSPEDMRDMGRLYSQYGDLKAYIESLKRSLESSRKATEQIAAERNALADEVSDLKDQVDGLIDACKMIQEDHDREMVAKNAELLEMRDELKALEPDSLERIEADAMVAATEGLCTYHGRQSLDCAGCPIEKDRDEPQGCAKATMRGILARQRKVLEAKR